MGFAFFTQKNRESLAAFCLPGRPIRCKLNWYVVRMTEAVALRFSVKKVFLKISLNSLEKICAKVSILIKLKAEAFCFPVNFAKFLRTPISKEDLWWLPLEWNTQKGPKKMISQIYILSLKRFGFFFLFSCLFLCVCFYWRNCF